VVETVRRSILHVDLDAFYASVEQLRRPELRGKPIAVGGGVVLAASYEARAFGVRSAMPIGKARQLCPRLVVVSGSFGDYVTLSDRVMDLCADVTPHVEQVSIDEAFLDVTGSQHLLGPAEQIGRQVRKAVLDQTGLVVSVGCAPTKFLAKVASQVAKPNGLVSVPPGEELDFLHPLPVSRLWGVGPATGAKLQDMGIFTIGELAATPEEALRSRIGPHAGRRLHDLAFNRDPRSVIRHSRAGSVGASSTFGRDSRDLAEHRKVLMRLADRVGKRLRSKQRAARTVTVRVRFADFETHTHAITLRAPIGTTEAIFRTAIHLTDEVMEATAAGRGLRLLGISLSKLSYSPHIQLELPFAAVSREDVRLAGSTAAIERERLDEAIDGLRERFGRNAVGPGSLLLGRSESSVPEEFGDLAVPASERRSSEPDE
jgi:DNA polymerase-4